MNNKKFIITQDESVCHILIAHGFRLLSNVCGVYTFINHTTGNFNFANIDATKIHFTDNLSL